jgi:predicted ester cyclase
MKKSLKLRAVVSPTPAFKTPVSPEPLMGAEGYLCVVTMMRKSFPDVQWKLEDMVADANTVAVQWTCSGTFTGAQPFAGVQPNGRRFSTTVMNFYKFDENGLIVDDIAGVAESIIVGQPVTLGTGAVNIIYKPKNNTQTGDEE